MQQKTVDVIGAKMLQRTCHRLRDLNRQTCCMIIGKAMILSLLVNFVCRNSSARCTTSARYAAPKPSPTPASK